MARPEEVQALAAKIRNLVFKILNEDCDYLIDDMSLAHKTRFDETRVKIDEHIMRMINEAFNFGSVHKDGKSTP